MSIQLRFMLFFATAMIIVILLYWLVIGRLFSYFNIKHAWIVAVSVVLVTFFAMFLQGKLNSVASYSLQMSMLTILGIVWFSIVVIAIAEIAKFFIPKEIVGFLALGTIAILTGIALISANTLQIEKITLTSPKITEPVRVVQLSDLHIQGPNGNEHYQKIIKKALDQNPDIILITGDIIDPGLPAKLSYDTKVPIIATFGNHEFYVGENFSEKYLTDSGMNVLRSKSIDFKGITIIGIDDAAALPRVQAAIANANTKQYSILMYHSPKNVDNISGVDLILSGHTHAGQIFPFRYLVNTQFKYVNGLFDLNGTKLYVSSGAGTWGPPMRLGTNSEIVVFDIKPAQ